MTPLARPVRFPEPLEKLPLGELLNRLKGKLKDRPRGWPRALAGLGGQRSGDRTACSDCLRPTALYFGHVPLCDHCARMRALEILNDAKETTMTTEYAEYTRQEIESELVARTYAYIDERNLDRVKDYVNAHHAVLDDHPALKLAYAGVGGPVVGPGFVRPLDPLNRPADEEGPRHQPVPVPDALLVKKIEDYRGRYPEVADATTRFDFFRLFLKGLMREDPAHARDNYRNARITDPELAALGAQGGA